MCVCACVCVYTYACVCVFYSSFCVCARMNLRVIRAKIMYLRICGKCVFSICLLAYI